MGQMKLDLFKQIIDEAQGNIPFITLASRGADHAARIVQARPAVRAEDGGFRNFSCRGGL
jgi:hypothetical protein